MQPMPSALQPQATRVAGNFVPPSDIGGGSSPAGMIQGGQFPQNSVTTNDLPVLATSTSGDPQMSAHSPSASVQLAARPATLGETMPSVDVDTPASTAVSGGFRHVIESGESLYTIARRYNVTAQAIVQANGLASPDKIYVGQSIVIPGRPDLGGQRGGAAPATQTAATAAPSVQVAAVSPNGASPIGNRQLLETETPVATGTQATTASRPSQQPIVEPTLSGADKFRWPVSGRVIVDFAASRQTGINIEVPEGAAVRAAENGQVIYVGNGVEGYGNLILIRHPNGYVSAYAHLKDMKVQKNDVVNRGDQVGSAGMTGSVTRPQLHFELRKGATPVDPIPLLAS